jgi:hypothetical protein
MAMDLICVPMSPIPLSFMDSELTCICGFNDIDSFLTELFVIIVLLLLDFSTVVL